MLRRTLNPILSAVKPSTCSSHLKVLQRFAKTRASHEKPAVTETTQTFHQVPVRLKSISNTTMDNAQRSVTDLPFGTGDITFRYGSDGKVVGVNVQVRSDNPSESSSVKPR